MATRRIRATTGASARRKGKSKTRTVTKVNYIKGSRKGRTGSYSVTTRKKRSSSRRRRRPRFGW